MKINKNLFIKILDDYYSLSPPFKFVVAVDFDNCLCASNYPNTGKEIKPVCDFIRSIRDLNCYIILNTCRNDKALTNAVKWCKNHNIIFDFINENAPDRIAYFGDCRKISCNINIDDMNYHFDAEDFT